MDKVKTLLESLKEGPNKAFENLDKKIEDLGEIEIQDVKDERVWISNIIKLITFSIRGYYEYYWVIVINTVDAGDGVKG